MADAGNSIDNEALDYNAVVLDHFRSPRNSGDLPEANAVGRASNPAMSIKLMLRIAGGTIVQARFQTKGCPASIATSSMATELLRGRSVKAAGALSQAELLEALGGLPKAKHHCPALVERAIADALRSYAGV